MDKAQCNSLSASTRTKNQKDCSNGLCHSISLNLRQFDPISDAPMDVQGAPVGFLSLPLPANKETNNLEF